MSMKISDVAQAAKQFRSVLEKNSMNCRIVVTVHDDQWERFEARAHQYLVPPDRQWPARKISSSFMMGGIDFRKRIPDGNDGFTVLTPRFQVTPPRYGRKKLRTVVFKKESA